MHLQYTAIYFSAVYETLWMSVAGTPGGYVGGSFLVVKILGLGSSDGSIR